MTFVSDRLYNEVIRKNLAKYSSKINVREIMPHLPCLTITDRENVEAKKDSSGNYDAVQMLLVNLSRRENWPDQFIEALRQCEHHTMADELSAAYDRIKGNTNRVATPRSAPAQTIDSSAAAPRVTTATIHMAPSNGAPQEPSPPVVPQVPERQHEQVNVPAPADTPKIVQPVVAAPPVVVAPPPTEVILPIQQNYVPTNSVATENQTPILDTQNVQTTTSLNDDNALSTLSARAQSQNDQISQTLENIKLPLAVKESSENPPIQETNPPLNKEGPEECIDPTANEIAQRANTAGLPGTAQTNTVRPAQATSSAPANTNGEEYFSKPGILQAPTDANSTLQEEPCSTVSDDLEISNSEPGQSTSIGSLSTTNETSHLNTEVPSLSLEENIPARPDAPISPNQPEENHYDSLCSNQIGVLHMHIAEEPSAENLNGQPLSMLGNAADPSANAAYPRNTFGRDDIGADRERSILNQDQESNAGQHEQREECQINKLYIAAAAVAAASVGIGLILAWKIKH